MIDNNVDGDDADDDDVDVTRLTTKTVIVMTLLKLDQERRRRVIRHVCGDAVLGRDTSSTTVAILVVLAATRVTRRIAAESEW